jgi:hypothetical protein
MPVPEWGAWALEIEALTDAKPAWDDEMIPRCSEDCPHHDGKRCRALGQRPDGICEVAVERMADLLCRRSP